MFWTKLKSRKFLTALAGLIVGAAAMLGVEADEIQTVAGAVISALSLIGYIVTEGQIDIAALKTPEKDADEDDE